MHYILIVLIIIYILYRQITIYKDTTNRLHTFSGIFPASVSEDYKISRKGLIVDRETEETINKKIQLLDKQIDDALLSGQPNDYILPLKEEREKLSHTLYLLSQKESNSIWNRILSSINRYLEKNKGSISDFHLIKDIVDRNCDAEDETIQTQIPMPLYFGLMGTMAGIIIGVGYLWLSGGLAALLSSGQVATSKATDGIIALLGGVALAMICSIVGIYLTTKGSSIHKDVKISVEERKHAFLSWLQSELLPKLNNDFGDAMTKVTANLTQFNDTFSANADKLHHTLNDVNKATEGQAQLLMAIENLKISKIASANIEVYDKLKNCTDEIGLLADQLESSRKYLDEVKALNEKLDASEQRTRAIEDMAVFFKEERGKIGAMQSVLNQAIGEIQTNLHNSIEHLKEASTNQITELVAHTTEQRQRLQLAIDEQEKVLVQKTSEINRLVTNLSSIEKMVQTLESSTRKQSQAISTLSQEIKELATQKASGTVTVKQERLPKWARIMIIIGSSIVSSYCLFALIIWIVNLISSY